MKPLWLALLLLLTACAPTLTQQQTTPIIPGATAQTLAYGDYTTYYETLGEGKPIVLVHSIGGAQYIALAVAAEPDSRDHLANFTSTKPYVRQARAKTSSIRENCPPANCA